MKRKETFSVVTAIRLVMIGLVTFANAQAGEPVLSKDAPADKPAHATSAEQVFIAVSSVEAGIVKGIIYNPIQVVSGYKFGQAHSFPESELVDWLITKPDGSEEGNVVGKSLDTYTGE